MRKGKSMRKLSAIILILVFVCAHTAFADKISAIEYLHELGIVFGKEYGLASDEFITYGEFADVAVRMNLGMEEYISAMNSLSMNRKEAVAYIGDIFVLNSETAKTIREKFDEYITPREAARILCEMLTYMSEFERFSVGNADPIDGLERFGYDVRLIPPSGYITRGKACEMLCGIYYVAYPVDEGYDGIWSLRQYVPNGHETLIFGSGNVGFENVIAAATAKKRPVYEQTKEWCIPVNFRSREYFEKNLFVGQSRTSVLKLVGEAYKTENDVEKYFVSDGDSCGFIEIKFNDNEIELIEYAEVGTIVQ